jgi:hypothetical protein
MILVPDNDRSVMRSIHVSERQTGNPVTYNRMPKSIRREIEDSVDKAGFDFDKLRTSIFERCVYNAWIYNHLDQFIDLTYKKANWEILV